MSQVEGKQSKKDAPSKLTFSGIRDRFKKKPKAKPTVGKSRKGSFRMKFRKVSTEEGVEGSFDVGLTSSSVEEASLPVDSVREEGEFSGTGPDADRAFTEIGCGLVTHGAGSDAKCQEPSTGSLGTETSGQTISSPPPINTSSSAINPSSSTINPSSSANNPSSSAINPSSSVINPSLSDTNPSSTSLAANSFTSTRHNPSLPINDHFNGKPTRDSTELNRTQIADNLLKATSLDEFNFRQKLKDEVTASVSSVRSEPLASSTPSTNRTMEKTLSLVSFAGEGSTRLREEELSSSFNQKGSNSPPLSRRRTVSVMATSSMFGAVEDIKAAKTAAIQRAKERRKPPSKPLPYALTKKLSCDPEATPLMDRAPGRVVLGPRSSRPPVPFPPDPVTTTHERAVGRVGVSRPNRPLPPSIPQKQNSSPVKAITPPQARVSPTKMYRLPTTPPTHPPPRYCPITPSRLSPDGRTSTTLPQSGPPSPYSTGALELLKDRSWSCNSEAVPPNLHKLTLSHNNSSFLKMGVSPWQGPSTTLPTNSVAVSRTSAIPAVSRYNPAVTAAAPQCKVPPVYEEIKGWMKVSQCRGVNPRGGRSMPDWAGGAVVHPRSDSSDADDYVDMKSFAGKENFEEPADDTYMEMKPIKPGEVCLDDDDEQESVYMHMNPVTLVPSLLPESERSALHPPPANPAPVYAAINQLSLPPRKAMRSLHYASRNLLYSKRS